MTSILFYIYSSYNCAGIGGGGSDPPQKDGACATPHSMVQGKKNKFNQKRFILVQTMFSYPHMGEITTINGIVTLNISSKMK